MAETKTIICLGACDPKCGNCLVPVEVELTPEEIAERDAMAAAAQAEAEAKAAADAAAAAAAESGKAKLAAIGLTPEEIAALTK